MENLNTSSPVTQEILSLIRNMRRELASIYNQMNIPELSEVDWRLYRMCLSHAVNALAAASTILGAGPSDVVSRPLTMNAVISSLSHMMTNTSLMMSALAKKDYKTSTSDCVKELVSSVTLLALREVQGLEDCITTLSTLASRFKTSLSTLSKTDTPITPAEPSPGSGEMVTR